MYFESLLVLARGGENDEICVVFLCRVVPFSTTGTIAGNFPIHLSRFSLSRRCSSAGRRAECLKLVFYLVTKYL